MKKINFYILIIILALIIIPQLVLADCQDFGTKKVCDMDRGEYNITTPTIILEFYEDPITIKNDEFWLYNKDLQINQSIENMKTENGKRKYTFKPSNHLPNGKYLFFANSTDIDENVIELYVHFEINASNMNVWVKTPKNNHIKLGEQKFAVGNTEKFDLELGLERPANCGYKTVQPSGENSLKDHYESSKLFDTGTQNLIAYINNFSMKTDYGDTAYKHTGDLKELYIICKEIDVERYVLNAIKIGSDGTQPVITIKKDPDIIIDSNNLRTNFTIKTTDESVCTIKNTDPGTGTYTYNIIHKPGFKFTTKEEFQKEQSEELTFNYNINPPKYTYKFNVTCENMANYKSSQIEEVKTDIKIIQEIFLEYPNQPINSQTFDLNISINQGEDTCSYVIDDKEGTYKPFTKTQKTINGRTIHTAKVTTSEGEHKIYVNCLRISEPKEFEIQIDTQAPPSPNIIAKDYTCNTRKVKFEINGTDNEDGSGIYKYHYNITFDDEALKNKNIIGTTRSNKKRVTIDEKLPLTLNDTYLEIQVYPEDKAGNIPTYPATHSMQITNSSILECDFTKPTIKINKTQDPDTKEWTLFVECEDEKSGCQNTFDYSTHTKDENCTYETYGNTYENPIPIYESVKFCAIVYDNNNNNATYETELVYEYPVSCFNEKQDLTETDIDCGGDCMGCEIEQTCKKDSDCYQNYCSDQKTCQIPSCTDKQKNGFETDVDCGGSDCLGCPLENKCKQDSDCQDKNCNSGKCQEATCTDGKVDGEETDYDCGGYTCEPCSNGQRCEINEDCETNYDCNTEGKCWLSRDLDTDGDGMPDWWEKENGLNPNDPSDANKDTDKDGYTNLEEYNDNTNPRDGEDFPDYHKLNMVSLILLILGGLSLIIGTLLVVLEHIKNKKQEEEQQQKAFQEAISGAPQPISLTPKIPLEKPKYTSQELNLRQKHREVNLSERKNKRREIFNEFTTTKTQNKPPKNPNKK